MQALIRWRRIALPRALNASTEAVIGAKSADSDGNSTSCLYKSCHQWLGQISQQFCMPSRDCVSLCALSTDCLLLKQFSKLDSIACLCSLRALSNSQPKPQITLGQRNQWSRSMKAVSLCRTLQRQWGSASGSVGCAYSLIRSREPYWLAYSCQRSAMISARSTTLWL